MMIKEIQTWLENTYLLQREMPASRFLIDHAVVLDYLGENHPLSRAEELVLMMGSDKDFQLGLYLHPSILEETKEESQARRSHRWLTATEGVSHLLLLSHKLRMEEEVTQLELELQAEIDKFLFATMVSPENGTLIPTYHLNQPASLGDLNPGRLDTYAAARRLACRYCSKLEREFLCGRSYDGLFEELRQFYRLSHWKKLKVLGAP